MKIMREGRFKAFSSEKNHNYWAKAYMRLTYTGFSACVYQDCCERVCTAGSPQDTVVTPCFHSNNGTERDSVILTMPNFWPFCPVISLSTEAPPNFCVFSRLPQIKWLYCHGVFLSMPLFSVLDRTHFKSQTGLKLSILQNLSLWTGWIKNISYFAPTVSLPLPNTNPPFLLS